MVGHQRDVERECNRVVSLLRRGDGSRVQIPPARSGCLLTTLSFAKIAAFSGHRPSPDLALASAPMLSAGIVGLPNVGKSTLFNAVTRTRKAQAANYPFCTIDPNLGVVTVPDARLDVLGKLSQSKKNRASGDRVRRHCRIG